MDTAKHYSISALKWSAMAGGYGAIFIGAMIISGWVALQFLILLMQG